MFSWKKICFSGLVIAFAIVVVFMSGMLFLSWDTKDRCLDEGGRYHEVNQTCEK